MQMANAADDRGVPEGPTMRRFSRARAGVSLLLCSIALAAIGCAAQPGSVQSPVGTAAVSGLDYSNGTSLGIDLFINGKKVLTMLPGTANSIPVSNLTALPWTVEARTSVGRVLGTMTVRQGDVVEASAYQRGDAFRVNLPCGVLDIWSGPPLIGPVATTSPGDCEP
jgi:hypothetical protein